MGGVEAELEQLRKHAKVIRAICHTQVRKVPIGQKKAHAMEIQINGGSVAEKVDFCAERFVKEVAVDEVFAKDENIDTVGVSRWGGYRLPRKTHRGLRKVACIGSWHPSRVAFS